MGDYIFTRAGLPIAEGGFALSETPVNGEFYNTEDGTYYTVAEIADVVLGYFDEFGNETFADFSDDIDVPAGCPIVLQNKSFEFKWSDARTTWKNLDTTATFTYAFKVENWAVGTVVGIRNKVSGEFVETTITAEDTAETVWDRIIAESPDFLNGFKVTRMDSESDSILDTLLLVRKPSTRIRTDLEAYPRQSSESSPYLDLNRIGGTNINTWESIGRNNFYEIEWIVEKDSNQYEDFYFKDRGFIHTHNNLSIVLPYPGEYQLTMKLYDGFNNLMVKKPMEKVNVYPYNLEIAGAYKALGPIPRWNNSEQTWERFTSTWGRPFIPKKLPRPELNYLYSNLDRNGFGDPTEADQMMSFKYISQPPSSYTDADGNTIYEVPKVDSTPGPFHWKNLGSSSWEDAQNIWWEATTPGFNSPASFIIRLVKATGVLSLVQKYPTPATDTITFDTDSIDDAYTKLNDSTGEVFSKYSYTKVTDDNDNTMYIIAIANDLGRDGDFYHIESDENVDIQNKMHHENYAFTKENSIVFEDHEEISPLTHVVFSYDHSLVPGKNNPKWTLVNNNDNINEDIYSYNRYFSYLFKNRGNYTIKLELQDSNKNLYTVQRNLITVK